MQAARKRHAWLLAVVTAGPGPAAVAAPPLSDDFFAYLGSWDADDADWQVAAATASRPVSAAMHTQNVSQQTPANATPTKTANSRVSTPRSAASLPASSTERKP